MDMYFLSEVELAGTSSLAEGPKGHIHTKAQE